MTPDSHILGKKLSQIFIHQLTKYSILFKDVTSLRKKLQGGKLEGMLTHHGKTHLWLNNLDEENFLNTLFIN